MYSTFWDGSGGRKLAGLDTGNVNVCNLRALFTNSVGICVPSIRGMTDCPSIAKNRAGQTWLSASFDSVNSCHVNFSGCQPMPHSIILNPFCKAIILWPLRASHTGKGNETICGISDSVCSSSPRQADMDTLIK